MPKSKDTNRALEAIRCMVEALIDHAEFGRGWVTPVKTLVAFMPGGVTARDLETVLGLLPGVTVAEGYAHGLRVVAEVIEDSPLVRFIEDRCAVDAGRKTRFCDFYAAYNSEESPREVAKQLRLLPGVVLRPGTGNQLYVYGLEVATTLHATR